MRAAQRERLEDGGRTAQRRMKIRAANDELRVARDGRERIAHGGGWCESRRLRSRADLQNNLRVGFGEFRVIANDVAGEMNRPFDRSVGIAIAMRGAIVVVVIMIVPREPVIVPAVNNDAIMPVRDVRMHHGKRRQNETDAGKPANDECGATHAGGVYDNAHALPIGFTFARRIAGLATEPNSLLLSFIPRRMPASTAFLCTPRKFSSSSAWSC